MKKCYGAHVPKLLVIRRLSGAIVVPIYASSLVESVQVDPCVSLVALLLLSVDIQADRLIE